MAIEFVDIDTKDRHELKIGSLLTTILSSNTSDVPYPLCRPLIIMPVSINQKNGNIDMLTINVDALDTAVSRIDETGVMLLGNRGSEAFIDKESLMDIMNHICQSESMLRHTKWKWLDLYIQMRKVEARKLLPMKVVGHRMMDISKWPMPAIKIWATNQLKLPSSTVTGCLKESKVRSLRVKAFVLANIIKAKNDEIKKKMGIGILDQDSDQPSTITRPHGNYCPFVMATKQTRALGLCIGNIIKLKPTNLPPCKIVDINCRHISSDAPISSEVKELLLLTRLGIANISLVPVRNDHPVDITFSKPIELIEKQVDFHQSLSGLRLDDTIKIVDERAGVNVTNIKITAVSNNKLLFNHDTQMKTRMINYLNAATASGNRTNDKYTVVFLRNGSEQIILLGVPSGESQVVRAEGHIDSAIVSQEVLTDDFDDDFGGERESDYGAEIEEIESFGDHLMAERLFGDDR